MAAEQPHDYYKTLGLPRACTAADIKKAYKLIALLTHPDKCPGDPNATEKFKILGQAHETLSDPEKRRKYDSQNPERQYTANSYQWSHDPDPFWTEATGFSTPRDPFMGYQYTANQSTGPQSTGSYSTTGSYTSGSYNARNQNNESQNTERFKPSTRDPTSWTFYNSRVDDAWMRRQISLYKSGSSKDWFDAGIDTMANWAWKKGDFSAWEDVKLTQWEREEWEVEKEQFKDKKRGEEYRVKREWQRGCLKKMWVKNPHAATTAGSDAGRGSASQSAKETADRGANQNANQSTPQTSAKDTLGYERWMKSQIHLFKSKLSHSHGEVDIDKISKWAWGKGDFALWADVKIDRWHKTYGYSIPEKKLPILREQYRQDLKGQWKKNPHATNGSNAEGNADSRPESQTTSTQSADTRYYSTSGINAWGSSRRSQSTTSQSTPNQSPQSQSSARQSTPSQSLQPYNTFSHTTSSPTINPRKINEELETLSAEKLEQEAQDCWQRRHEKHGYL